MDYLECIQRSLDHIETHIHEPLTVAELAKLCGFSPYHFYRIFGAYVGMPVMEYVRRRRLAYAAAELATSRRILDIALDYGFETHGGFTKAFHKVFGMSPERYRLHASDQIPVKIDLLFHRRYYHEGGIVLEPKVLKRDNFHVVGYVLETTAEGGQNNQEIPKFWQEYLENDVGRNLLSQPTVKGDAEYGICFARDTDTSRFIYCIGMEVADPKQVDEQLFTGHVPAATYAVFTTPPTNRDNFSHIIQQTWQYIYGEWFPQSSYEFAEGCADFELYDERCHGGEGIVMDIYVPVVRKVQ